MLSNSFPAPRVHLGFVHYLVVDRMGLAGNLGLFWKNSVDVNVLSFSTGHIDVCVKGFRSDYPCFFTRFLWESGYVSVACLLDVVVTYWRRGVGLGYVGLILLKCCIVHR